MDLMYRDPVYSMMLNIKLFKESIKYEVRIKRVEYNL